MKISFSTRDKLIRSCQGKRKCFSSLKYWLDANKTVVKFLGTFSAAVVVEGRHESGVNGWLYFYYSKRIFEKKLGVVTCA